LSPEGRELAERFIAALEARTTARFADWPAERVTEAAGVARELAARLDGGPTGRAVPPASHAPHPARPHGPT
jgi:hypothetical protein